MMQKGAIKYPLGTHYPPSSVRVWLFGWLMTRLRVSSRQKYFILIYTTWLETLETEITAQTRSANPRGHWVPKLETISLLGSY